MVELSENRSSLTLMAAWGAFSVFVLVAVLHLLVAEVTAFDQRVISFVFGSADPGPFGSQVLATIARDVTSLGSPALLLLLAIFGIAWSFAHADRRGAILVAVVGIGATILSYGFKILFGRERPGVAVAFVVETSPSFPSGHSLLTAALLPAVAIILVRRGLPSKHSGAVVLFAIVMALLVALTRILLGAHFPTDVVAGSSLGFAWIAVCKLWLDRVEDASASDLR